MPLCNVIFKLWNSIILFFTALRFILVMQKIHGWCINRQYHFPEARFKHPLTFLWQECRAWVICCHQSFMWWKMSQRHFGALLHWWNEWLPISIVTKMGCTPSFWPSLRYLWLALYAGGVLLHYFWGCTVGPVLWSVNWMLISTLLHLVDHGGFLDMSLCLFLWELSTFVGILLALSFFWWLLFLHKAMDVWSPLSSLLGFGVMVLLSFCYLSCMVACRLFFSSLLTSLNTCANPHMGGSSQAMKLQSLTLLDIVLGAAGAVAR